VDITGPPPIEISNIDVTDVECFGSTNGVIDITASGGTGDLYYTLTLGATTIGPQVNDGLFINLTNGDYDISITDDNGCELTDNATILSPDELILTTQVDDVTCSDSGNDGKITAKGNGGNPPYTITLFKGGIQQNQYTNVDEDIVVEFIGLAGGNDYEVEVDDTKGCGPVASGLLTVIVPDPLVINPPVIENLTCNGVPTGKVTVTGTGGNPPYTFVLYDSGDNALETLNDNAGVEFVDYPAATGYYVTIDDTNGCGPIATAPFDITEPDAITIDPLSVTTTDISCNGFDDGEVSVTATGGTGNLYYTLLQGGIPVVGFATQTNNGTFSPLEPGTYTISITDDESCGPVVSTDLVVNEPDPINLTVNVIDIVCNGDQGSITAQANQGTAPFDFVLSQDAIDIANFDDIAADTEVEFANLDAGDPVYTYVVTVTDANGCFVSSADLTIFEPSAIVIDNESSTPISCNGQDNGSISVDASGGTGILTYTLSEDVLGEITNNETGEFIDLEPGIYTVTIEDENGCAGPSAGPYNLTEPSAIEFDVDVTGLTCFGDEVTVTVINVIGGSGVGYQYSFDGGAFSPSNEYKFTPTEGGVVVDVTVVVKDDADCETTEVETITIPGELLIDVTIVSHPLCNGGNQGEIQATSTGGTPPIFYEVDGNGLWNSGGNFTDLSAGFHTVVVSDFKGCSNSTTVELIDPPAITIDPLDILAVDPTCSDPGLISVEATGGTGTLTYTLWEQTLGEITNNTTGLFENLGGGDYKVYVTDANNCGPDSTDIIPLVSPSTISVDDIIITHATGCFSITNPPENGSIEILASGGNGPLQYSIDNGVTFSSNNLFEGQKPGDYSIIVTDG
ncbi:MAG TPA: SprB repeat-containing protein, partial [Tenuifilaceae bacterium]|nr:SprB repeat-containing protein [Tenuifilaceae bacterium]